MIPEWFKKNILRQYNVDVTIWQKRGNDHKKIEDIASYRPERLGKRYYWLYNLQKEVKIPLEYMNSDGHVNIYQEEEDILEPFKFDFSKFSEQGDNPGYKAVDEDTRYWISNQLTEADMMHTVKPGFLEKHGNIISAAVMLIGAGVFFLLLNKGMSENIQQLTTAVESFKSAMQGAGGGGF